MENHTLRIAAGLTNKHFFSLLLHNSVHKNPTAMEECCAERRSRKEEGKIKYCVFVSENGSGLQPEKKRISTLSHEDFFLMRNSECFSMTFNISLPIIVRPMSCVIIFKYFTVKMSTLDASRRQSQSRRAGNDLRCIVIFPSVPKNSRVADAISFQSTICSQMISEEDAPQKSSKIVSCMRMLISASLHSESNVKLKKSLT